MQMGKWFCAPLYRVSPDRILYSSVQYTSYGLFIFNYFNTGFECFYNILRVLFFFLSYRKLK